MAKDIRSCLLECSFTIKIFNFKNQSEIANYSKGTKFNTAECVCMYVAYLSQKAFIKFITYKLHTYLYTIIVM